MLTKMMKLPFLFVASAASSATERSGVRSVAAAFFFPGRIIHRSLLLPRGRYSSGPAAPATGRGILFAAEDPDVSNDADENSKAEDARPSVTPDQEDVDESAMSDDRVRYFLGTSGFRTDMPDAVRNTAAASVAENEMIDRLVLLENRARLERMFMPAVAEEEEESKEEEGGGGEEEAEADDEGPDVEVPAAEDEPPTAEAASAVADGVTAGVEAEADDAEERILEVAKREQEEEMAKTDADAEEAAKKKQAEEEAEAEEARRAAEKEEEEARLKAEEEEKARAEAEAEAKRKQLEEEEAARKAAEEEEARRKAAEEEAAREAEAEEAAARRAEEDAKLKPLKDRATGIEFQPKLGVGDDDLYLLGVGVRKKAIINVYSVGAYSSRDVRFGDALSSLSAKSDRKEALETLRYAARAAPATSFLLEMAFKAGADAMASAIAESVAPRHAGDKSDVDELKALIFDGVKAKGGAATKGTKLRFDCRPGEGVGVSVDGNLIGEVQSEDLGAAFCDVFLDDKAVSPPLRDNCLQNCCGS